MAKDKKPTVGRRVARPGRNTPVSEKMQIGLRKRAFSRTTFIVVVVLACISLAVAGLFTFYNKVYANPQHVFNEMINNNLATRGFTKEIKKSQGSSTSDETTQIIFTPQIMVRDVRKVNSPMTKTKVTVETVASPEADYQHYVAVDRTSAAGKKLDYSSIYGLWVKSNQGSAQLVNSSFFGATLFGNLDPASRKQITHILAPAYKVDYKNVAKQTVNSRRVYTYDVAVMLKPYSEAAHKYAQAMSLPIADQIDPNIYKSGTHFSVEMSVDVLSRQLTQVIYRDQGVTETYSGYGAVPEIRIPAKTVTPAQLTEIINSIGQ